MSNLPPQTHTAEPDEALPSSVRPTQHCPPLSILRAHQEEVLPATLAADVNRHIEQCPLCRMLLTDLQHIPQPAITTDERDRILRKLPHASPTVPAGWHWYAAAAAAIHPRRRRSLPLPPPASSEPAQPSHHPTHPDPRPSNHSPLASRSPNSPFPSAWPPASHSAAKPPPSNPPPPSSAPAFEAYANDDYPLAAQRFTELADQFPRAELPFLYLGVTQLLQQDNAHALTALTRADTLAQQNHSTQKTPPPGTTPWPPSPPTPPTPRTSSTPSARNTQSPYSQQACDLREASTH